MKWVLAQALLFAVILFVPFEMQYVLPSVLKLILRAIAALGFVILARAIYDLRRSLAISPIPKQTGQLQITGIYRFIRHPMYVAVWLILGSGILASGSIYKYAMFILLIVFFVLKVRHEESLLLKAYPGYDQYKKRVGAFFPKLQSKHRT